MVDPAPVVEAAELARERVAQQAARATVAVDYRAELVEAMALGAARAGLVGELSRVLAALRVPDGCPAELRQRADRLTGALRVLVDAAGRADASQLDQVRKLAAGMVPELRALRDALDGYRGRYAIEAAEAVEDDDQAAEVDQVETVGRERIGPAAVAEAARWAIARASRPALLPGRQVAPAAPVRCKAYGCPRDAVVEIRGVPWCGPHAYPGAASPTPGLVLRGRALA